MKWLLIGSLLLPALTLALALSGCGSSTNALNPANNTQIIGTWQSTSTRYVISSSDVITYGGSGGTWTQSMDVVQQGGSVTLVANTAIVALPQVIGGSTMQTYSIGANGDLYLATGSGLPEDTGCTKIQ